MPNTRESQLIHRPYDCVVVGAGNGGLSAAAQLAAKGAKVLLLEQHNLPGGFATSFVRGRFEFEAALHEFADVGSPLKKGGGVTRGGVRTYLEDDLGIRLDWVEAPEAFRLLLTDPGEEMDVTMPYGPEAYLAAMERYVPGCRESVRNYLDLYNEIGEAIVYLAQSRGNPDRNVLTTKYANFLKTCPYSVDQVARAMRLPEQAKKILHAQWTYIGPPTSRMNYTIYAAMMNKFINSSAYIPRYPLAPVQLGGVGALSRVGRGGAIQHPCGRDHGGKRPGCRRGHQPGRPHRYAACDLERLAHAGL